MWPTCADWRGQVPDRLSGSTAATLIRSLIRDSGLLGCHQYGDKESGRDDGDPRQVASIRRQPILSRELSARSRV
jgi:hypothetical protein